MKASSKDVSKTVTKPKSWLITNEIDVNITSTKWLSGSEINPIIYNDVIKTVTNSEVS